MKNIQNILLAILAIGIAVLYFIQFKGCSASGPQIKLNPNSKDIAMAAGTRIAFVNTDSFFEGYKKYKAFEKEIEATQKSAEANTKTRMKAIEGDYMKLMQQAQAGQINQQQAQQMEKSLIDRKTALEKDAESIMKGMADKSKKATNDLYATMKKYFEDNKSKYGIDLVIGYQTNGTVLYFDPKMDITDRVLEDLNKEE